MNSTAHSDVLHDTDRLRNATLRVLTDVMVLAYQRRRADVTATCRRLRHVFFLSADDQAALRAVLREALELLDDLQA